MLIEANRKSLEKISNEHATVLEEQLLKLAEALAKHGFRGKLSLTISTEINDEGRGNVGTSLEKKFQSTFYPHM